MNFHTVLSVHYAIFVHYFDAFPFSINLHCTFLSRFLSDALRFCNAAVQLAETEESCRVSQFSLYVYNTESPVQARTHLMHAIFFKKSSSLGAQASALRFTMFVSSVIE